VDQLDTSEIGTTGLRVTRMGLGGAPLGGLFADVGDDVATRLVLRAHELGVRYFDTAPLYGSGKSERRYAGALAQIPRDEFVLSTKVGRLLEPVVGPPDSAPFVNAPAVAPVFDFSRDGVLRSLEASLERLGLERVDIALIHDPDDHFEQAIGGAYAALAELRSQGVVKAIGAGMNQWQMPARLAREGDFDCFLLAGRYTLLDQSGLVELLPMCEEKGISIVIGGPYNSGILASDLSPGATFDYMAAPPLLLDKARRISAVCDRHGVPLKAAALQFGLAHPAVAATIPGARSVAEVEENLAMAAHPIPVQLWEELRAERLISEAAPTPA
jgi:D-threo-aldose 1-dehydrogenase